MTAEKQPQGTTETATARLPRRYSPRNDDVIKRKDGVYKATAKAGLPRRYAPRNDGVKDVFT